MAFLTVNWLSILLAAVAAWLFGARLLRRAGKLWVAAQGKTMEQFKAEQAAKVGKFADAAAVHPGVRRRSSSWPGRSTASWCT